MGTMADRTLPRSTVGGSERRRCKSANEPAGLYRRLLLGLDDGAPQHYLPPYGEFEYVLIATRDIEVLDLRGPAILLSSQ